MLRMAMDVRHCSLHLRKDTRMCVRCSKLTCKRWLKNDDWPKKPKNDDWLKLSLRPFNRFSNTAARRRDIFKASLLNLARSEIATAMTTISAAAAAAAAAAAVHHHAQCAVRKKFQW